MIFEADESYTRLVKESYNLMSEEYDTHHASMPFYINCNRTTQYYLRKLLPHWQNRIVLDVGCGTGSQTLEFAMEAKRVFALDIADALLKKARDKLRHRGFTNVNFLLGDATEIPLKDSSVDYVGAYGVVISHLVNRIDADGNPIYAYERAISEMARVCKRGGIITLDYDNKWHAGLLYKLKDLAAAVRTPSKGDVRLWRQELLRFDSSVYLPYKTFTYKEMRSLLHAHNLKVLEKSGIDILSSLVPEVYHTPPRKKPRWNTFFGNLILRMWKVDFLIKGLYPFYKLGGSTVVVAQKQ